MRTVTGVEGQDAAGRTAKPMPGRRSRLAGGIALVGIVVVVLPDLVFGLDRSTPFVQLVSLRPYLVAALAGLVLVLAGVALRRRWLWVPVIGLATVVAAGAVMVLPRALPAPAPMPSGGRTLTVVAFNTLSGAADVGAVAALIRTERPDLVALVEAGQSYRSRLAPLVQPLGYRLFTAVGEDGGDLTGVTVVAADHLAAVRGTAHTSTPFPSVELHGGNLGELRFVAFHSLAPRRGDVPQWRSDVRGVARWCAGPTPAIIAGDFNATLDHSVFRSAAAGCSDVAAQLGQGLTPTWPTWLPDWLGPQIDHVITTGPIAAESFAVREIPGSDHRAVITRLRIPN